MYSYVSEYHSYVAVFTRISLAYGGVYLFVTPGTRTNWVFGKLHVIGGVISFEYVNKASGNSN